MSKKQLIVIGIIGAFLLTIFIQGQTAYDGTNGPGIDNSSFTAGETLSWFERGGRMVAFHNGFLYIMGCQYTTLWDVSDLRNPIIIDEKEIGDNGHRWYKLNRNIFWREYSVPEVAGSGYHFLDMSDMMDLKPYTGPAPVPIEEDERYIHWQKLETFPTGTNGGLVYDNRTHDAHDDPYATTSSFSDEGNVILDEFGSRRLRIGNLLLIVGQGLAVFDIGDPENVTFLDSLTGAYTQYTTQYQVWRSQVVYVNGDNNNEGGNNLVTIDFSDPTDLKFGFGLPYEQSPGRYVGFQDEFGFIGSGEYGTKINMETGTVDSYINAPGPWPAHFLDFQWIPAGPVLCISGSNGDEGKTFFVAHQDGPDTKGPEIGFHHPFDGSMGNPGSTVIGFVIAETLDERTLTNENIQVKIADEDMPPVEGDITWTSYLVLNFAPEEPLVPDKTYEVKLVQDGIKDVAGNGIDEFVFYFSTGNSLVVNERPVINDITYGSDTPVNVGQNLTISINAADADGDPLEYRWDFNDGAGNTAWSSSNSINRTYTSKGIKTINVQVRDDKGGFGASSRRIVVIDGDPGPAPVHSSAMALDPNARRLVVVNPDNNTVAFINPDSLTKTGEYPVEADPRSVTMDGSGQIWVSCMDANVVQVLNTSGSVIETINLGRGAMPFGILASPDGNTVYVAEQATGEITKMDAGTREIIDTLYVGKIPRAMAITGDGSEMYINRLISDPARGIVYHVDLRNFSLIEEIDLPADSTTPDSGNACRGVPNNRWAITINPSNTVAYSIGKKDNIFVGVYRDGKKSTFDTLVRSSICYIDMQTNREVFEQRKDVQHHANPCDMVFNPHGTHMFVAEQGNNVVIVYDPDNWLKFEVARTRVGLAPQGVLYDPVTDYLFVKNLNDRTVSVLDAGPMSNSGSLELPIIATIDTVANEIMPGQVLFGKQVFYNAEDVRMSHLAYFSCASCHTDGDHDGMVMDKGPDEGSRNTKSFIGKAGMKYGRVQWSANVDEMQDFEGASRAFLGKGFISDEDYNAGTRSDTLGDPVAGLSPEQDAIAAYVATMDTFPDSPYRNQDGSLTADGVAGKAIFEDLQCGSCHGEDTFTDSPRGYFHDVGTLKETSGKRLYMPLIGIDTPTLRDVWRTWPYLHDGSAKSLRDVIDINTNDAHGVTSGLTNTEKDQLVSYMLQIDGTEPAPGTPLLDLAFTSFSDGDVFSGDTIPLAISTSITGITEVTYYAFQEEVAGVTSSPWETTWSPGYTGRYLMHAKVTYNNGRTHSITDDTHVILAGVCTIDYNMSSSHPNGGQVDITITNNTDSDIVGYELTWTLGEGETITESWNADFSVVDSVATASCSADHYNGTIGANGGTVVMGFLYEKAGGVISMPTDFTVNGLPCSTTADTGPPPTPAPTDSGDTPTPTPTPTDTGVELGDVNSDGTVDIVDALVTAQYYVGLDPANFNSDAADVNCDGSIDIVDALVIAQYYVGLVSGFC